MCYSLVHYLHFQRTFYHFLIKRSDKQKEFQDIGALVPQEVNRHSWKTGLQPAIKWGNSGLQCHQIDVFTEELLTTLNKLANFQNWDNACSCFLSFLMEPLEEHS